MLECSLPLVDQEQEEGNKARGQDIVRNTSGESREGTMESEGWDRKHPFGLFLILEID